MPSKYLSLLEELSIAPNFWCSEEYFNKAKLKEFCKEKTFWVEDPEGYFMFPKLGQLGFKNSIPNKGIFSDFLDFIPKEEGAKRVFLDYEYLYDPKKFQKMEGSSWKVFRKNVRKFPKRNKSPVVYSSRVLEDSLINFLLIEWLENIEGIIYDSDMLLDYVFRGESRKVLTDEENKILYGMNVWDSNFKYTNFRFCICKRIPFLSEYMRWLFYTDEEVHWENKLINDGGVLDNPQLKFFKDKLNPVQVREVYSWEHLE